MSLFPSPKDVDYPQVVNIETTNGCNARCVFCPNNALSRKRQHMDWDLFVKIIEDCREFPLAYIEPFLQGEPFTDPKILLRLEYIRRRLPRTQIRICTNAAVLKDKHFRGLKEIGIDHLYVSINTTDPVRYRAIMGLKWSKTLEKLKRLSDPKLRPLIARRITLRMVRLPDTSLKEQQALVDLAHSLGFESQIISVFNFKGDLYGSSRPVPNYPCAHVERLEIMSNGLSTLCPMDHDGKYGWGDLRTHSVLEVYQSTVARHYRQLHRQGRRAELQPCGQCNQIWPTLRGLSKWKTLKYAMAIGEYWIKYRPTGLKAPEKKTMPVGIDPKRLERSS